MSIVFLISYYACIGELGENLGTYRCSSCIIVKGYLVEDLKISRESLRLRLRMTLPFGRHYHIVELSMIDLTISGIFPVMGDRLAIDELFSGDLLIERFLLSDI
jgi:hypothetical protein